MDSTSESEDSNKETNGLLPRHPEGERACVGEGEGRCRAPSASTLRRWYILAQFAFFGLLQNAVWNTYGPILLSTRRAFGWTVGDIALIPNIGNISLVLTIPIGSWFVSKFGLRVATLAAVGCILIGAIGRCITQHAEALLWLSLLCGVLIGFAGNANSGYISLLSSVWFPTHQRSTATSIVVFANTAGMAVSFIIGPLIVERQNPNSTRSDGNPDHVDGTYEQDLRDNIMLLNYIEAGLCGLSFLLMLIYFPARPATPPSASASTPRVNFLQGIKVLSRNAAFWLLCVSYGLTATFYSWGNVWNVNLSRLGLTEKESGWLGFYTTIAGAVACVVVSLLTDRFLRWMKLILLWDLILSSLSISVAALQCLQVLPPDKVVLYVSVILSGACIYASTPLMYELGSELAYPVQEGIVGLTLSFVNTGVAIIFLLLLEIPSLGTPWVLYCVWISFVVSWLLVIWVKPTYGRLNVDVTSDLSRDAASSSVQVTSQEERANERTER